MKLYHTQVNNQTININGRNVRFVNNIAEVDDEFGKAALKVGIPNLYEEGKQPAYQTPKEIQMQTDFAEKEDWYIKELARLKNIGDTRKERIKELEAEVAMWKQEYQKEHDARLLLLDKAPSEQAAPAPMPENNEEKPLAEDGGKLSEGTEIPEDAKLTEEQLRAELGALKKAELIQFAKDSGIDEAELADKTKAEITELIINTTKA